jgi:hypothetical protein
MLAAAGTTILRAQSGSELGNFADFGTLNQNNAGITVTNTLNVAPEACAPTATVNALVYLNNINGGNLFQNYNPSAQMTQAVNDMATAMGTFNVNAAGGGTVGGTSYGTTGPFATLNNGGVVTGMVSGTTNYITTVNPAPEIHMVGGEYAPTGTGNAQIPAGFIGTVPNNPIYQNVIPDANYLAALLNSDDAIEIGIQWGEYDPKTGLFVTGATDSNGNFIPGGGHIVTLDDLNFNSITNSGTIGFLDPDIGKVTTAVQENGTVSLEGGYLYVTYPLTLAGGPADANESNPGQDGNSFADFPGGQTGRIAVVLAEGVPDGGNTFLFLGAILIGLGAVHRRARRLIGLQG